MDAGNPQTYLYTNWDVLRRWAWPYEPASTDEQGGIWFKGRMPVLPESSAIEAPAALGLEITIGDKSRISSQTVIGDRVSIGSNCKIEASIIWNDVSIGNNVTMKNSIICNDVKIPAGSTLLSGTVVAPHYSNRKKITTVKGEILDKP